MERRYKRFFWSPNIIFFVGLACIFLACSRHATPDIPPAAIDHDGTEILSIEGSFQVSGIYPHLTTYSHGRVDGRQSYAGWAGRRGPEHGGQRECGIGAIVPWGGKLYMINYGAHEPEGSEHKLYIIDQDLRMEIFQGSVGGTPAGRMIHQESNQLFIGHYAIDGEGNIRVISIEEMPGRMTAIARHLTDPENKVYYFDMEGMLYEVDVHTLKPTLLYQKPLPGWHGKGAYTAQGRLVMANNGEQVPFRIHEEWQVDTTGIRGDENFGVLAEYDGERFTVIERKQYTDVTTRHGIHAIPDDQSPLWTMGWDKRSVRLKVLDQGQWHTWLLPKATTNNDPFHGWFTEWPRIRELQEGQFVMDMHGMFFDFPAEFSSEDASGIRPIGSHLRFITDFAWWNGQVVISCNETSVQGNPYAGQPQSNLWFGSFEELAEWGPKTGYGSVWVEDEVKAGEASLPYLFAGFDRRVVHLVNHSGKPVEMLVQLDRQGNGTWQDAMTLEVAPDGYTWHVFDAGMQAEWIRLVSNEDARITATFHYTDRSYHDGKKYAAMFEGLARFDDTGLVHHARLYPNHDNFNLTLHAGAIENGSFVPRNAFELNKYDFTYSEGLRDSTSLRILNNRTIWYQDEASVVLESAGQRLRLPMGKGSYTPEAIRNVRELASERELANIHGTFYEVPLLYVNQEGQYHMMRPVATHNRMISDMATWNGLLVLSGVRQDAKPSPHIISDAGQGLAVWVGGMDDIWKLGKPVGVGGPWKDTPVRANELSDKYLMTGYDKKTLMLTADRDVEVSVYVHTTHYMGLDIGDEPWREIKTVPKPLLYETFQLRAGETITHVFPEGYSAHWLQLLASDDCVATGWLVYE